MPELPEVEHLRGTLTPHLVGRTIVRVNVRRRDVIRVDRLDVARPASARVRRGLLEGARIHELRRHGKQLAIIADGDAPALLVQLGMTGQLIFVPAGQQPQQGDHHHVIWHLASEPPGDRLIFRDPRRFGGLTLFGSRAALESINWARLGPDALTVRHRDLHAALAATTRAVKAALLDQQVVAGVGNIYADEALHRAGIHPLHPAHHLDRIETRRLGQAIRSTLQQAVRAGGTTLRDYVDGNGRGGRNRPDLRAYGRVGLPCWNCGEPMEHLLVAQRTTTICPKCQPRHSSTSYPQRVSISGTGAPRQTRQSQSNR